MSRRRRWVAIVSTGANKAKTEVDIATIANTWVLSWNVAKAIKYIEMRECCPWGFGR